mmetsp:Transcript_9870/g.11077  ORF Transcript_9870/g.11077 Transcript_9870/m.11077 type:complete len:568 (-) Transcript_9870:133-1836(-)
MNETQALLKSRRSSSSSSSIKDNNSGSSSSSSSSVVVVGSDKLWSPRTTITDTSNLIAPTPISTSRTSTSTSTSSIHGTNNLAQARQLLYVSHFFNQFSEQTWQFCLALFLAAFTNNQSLILVTSYQLVSYLAVCCFGSSVGKYIDGSTKSRLLVARQFIGLENVCVVSATILCYILLSRDHDRIIAGASVDDNDNATTVQLAAAAEEEEDDDDDDNDGKNDVEEKENNTEEEGVTAVTVANMAAATSNHHRTRPDAAGTVIDTAIPAAAADGSVAVNPNSLRRSERKKKNSSNSTNNNVNNTATSNHHCTRSVADAATAAAGEAVAVAPTSDEEERPVEEQERANQQEVADPLAAAGVEAEAATRDIQQKLADKRSDMMDMAQDNMEEGLHGGQLVARMRLGLKMDRDYVTNTLIPKCMNKRDLDDYTSRNKRTAFMVAVRSGDKELIKLIWERYQSICNGGELRDVLTIKLNYSSSFWNVFMNACKCGNNDCIKLIHGYYIEPAMGDVRRVEIINSALACTLDFCQIDSKAKPYVLRLLGIEDVKFIGNYPADYGQRRSSARSSH